MRTILRAAAVATAAVAAIASTAGAASAAPRNHVSISAPRTVKAHHNFNVLGSGYDGRTRSGVVCLQQRKLVHGHWTAWKWEICEARRKGHAVGFDAVAQGGLNAGTYDLRLVLFSHPTTNSWKALDHSSIHKLTVR